jgi:hypothetical protein
MPQVSIAKVIAAKKIQAFMAAYMLKSKTLTSFLKEYPGFIKNHLAFLERKLKYPSRSVQDAASALIHELEWENVLEDHDWDIISLEND